MTSTIREPSDDAAAHPVERRREPVGEQPAFLLGAPRSGTSLVFKALCLHPDASFVSQWVQRFPRLRFLAVLDRVGRWSRRLQQRAWFPSGNAYAYGRDRSLAERLYPAPAEGEPVFAAAGIPVALVQDRPEVGPEIRRLRRSFRSIRRWSGGRVLVVKRIANNRRVPLLDVAFPHARYVEIVRDGRAVALSISRVNWWGPRPVWWLGQSPHDWEASGGDPLELTARHWVTELDTLEAGSADISPNRYLRIRYEDVVDAPIPTFRQVAGFFGLDPDHPEWLRRLELLQLPDNNQKWRDGLSDADVATIEAVQRDHLRRNGYVVGSAGDQLDGVE